MTDELIPPQFPLPDAFDYTAVVRSEVLKTISYLDGYIEAEKSHLAFLEAQRDVLLNRVTTEKIEDSGNFYVVELPQKKLRNPIDTKKFQERFPHEYLFIKNRVKNELTEQMIETDMGKFRISLEMADSVVGKDAVTEFVGFKPQKIVLEVRRKPERLA